MERSAVADPLVARQEQVGLALRRWEDLGYAILVAPTGSGKSHTLAAARDELRMRGFETLWIACRERPSPALLEGLAPGTVLLIDDLDHADVEMLHALFAGVAADLTGVATVTRFVGSEASSPSIAQFFREAEGRLDVSDLSPGRVALPPLDRETILRIAHRASPGPLDSAMASAIARLSCGRPGWVRDLVTLARAGLLTPGPPVDIGKIPLGELHLPALRSAAGSVGELGAEAAAAAIALSGIEPFDFTGATDFVGAAVAAELLEHGVLEPAATPGLYLVPRFLAVALRGRTSSALVDEARARIAQHLFTQEMLGLPLSEADTLFCARALQFDAAASDSPSPLQSAVLQRAAVGLLTFGRQRQARSLLLRAGGIGGRLDPVSRARAVSVFSAPHAALAALEQDPMPEGVDDRTGQLFLRAMLAADAGDPLPAVEPECDGTPAGDEEPPADLGADAATAFVFALWNSTRALTASEMDRLARVASGHPQQITALLAGALVDLEHVWRGRATPEGTWLQARRALPVPSMSTVSKLRDPAAALLLAQGLTALLAGEHALRREELLRAATRLPGAVYQELWMSHLLAVDTALACGDAERAGIEWNLLVERAPQFIPVRLRTQLESIAATFEGAAEIGPNPSLRQRYLAFLTDGSEPLARSTRKVDREALPIVRLGQAQIAATASQHPVELLRVSEQLSAFELWAPATHTVKTAHGIYLSRRAAGAVARCDERLRKLAERARRAVSWYVPELLPASHRVQLTPREFDAARLAAEGLANRDIAEALGCSVRTIESHLAQARAKLGAQNRGELAARLSVHAPRARESERV